MTCLFLDFSISSIQFTI